MQAVDELVAYRRSHVGKSLYVAECDIRKFFDILDHREVLRVYDEFVAHCPMPIDARMRQMLLAYLKSYDFNRYPKMAAAKDADAETMLRKVAKVDDVVVARLYGDVPEDVLRYGLPQGGALPPLIANMILTDADRCVQDGDADLFYVRFCDDMIIVHPDKDKCAAAMERYLDAVAKRKLPVHEPKPNGFAYGRDYFDVKTKGPFEWKACEMGTTNAAPWVGFLGNQIDYSGAVRIRRETISRHIAKLKGERGKFVRRMGAVCKGDTSKLKGKLSQDGLWEFASVTVCAWWRRGLDS